MGLFLWTLLGLVVGSFLNVLIERLPRGQNVIWGRSHCDWCKKPLVWYELIPLVSFLLQGGRCRRCRRRLSWQYPLVESVTALGFAVIFYFYAPTPWLMLAYLFIFSALFVIFVADLKYQIIPDIMIGVGILGALVRLFFLFKSPFLIANFLTTALIFSGFFLSLWLLTRGRGIGLGDVKLAFLLGLILGYPLFLIAGYAAFLTGAGVGVILILLGKKSLKSRVAFGPFLIVGAIVALIWGRMIFKWLGV